MREFFFFCVSYKWKHFLIGMKWFNYSWSLTSPHADVKSHLWCVHSLCSFCTDNWRMRHGQGYSNSIFSPPGMDCCWISLPIRKTWKFCCYLLELEGMKNCYLARVVKGAEAFLTRFWSFFKSVSTREQQKPVFLEALLFRQHCFPLLWEGKSSFRRKQWFICAEKIIPLCVTVNCVLAGVEKIVASNQNKSVNCIKLH